MRRGGKHASAARVLHWLGIIKRPPRIRQKINSQYLTSPVEVDWDNESGMVHVAAESLKDAFFAQGYLHGRERAFQMDILRRSAKGTLSEIMGERFIAFDTFMRRVNLSHWGGLSHDGVSQNTQRYLDQYTHGVNLAFSSEILPTEYRILKAPLVPWRNEDSHLVGLYWAWMQNDIWKVKWGYEQLNDFPDVQEMLFGDWLRDGTAVLSQEAPFDVMGSSFPGSNSWVVSGALTRQGHPLLANDIHMPSNPMTLWESMFLEGGQFHVFGATLPGLPGVIAGQNQHISWGMSNANVDCQDLFAINTVDNGLSYLIDDTEHQFITRAEVIQVKGAPEVTVQCLNSVWGPIIFDTPDEPKIALRWTGFQPSPLLQTILRVNRSHDWETFNLNLAEWTVPAQHFTYSDRGGHIGYILAGEIPKRSTGGAWKVRDGNTGKDIRNETIEWTDAPRLFDPNSGYIVAANNAPSANGEIGGAFSIGYRAQRIAALIQQTRIHTRDTLKRIQRDTYSEPLFQLSQRIKRVKGLPNVWKVALEEFDGYIKPDSMTPSLLYFFSLMALPNDLKRALDRPFLKSKELFDGALPCSLWFLLGERLVPIVFRQWENLDVPKTLEKALSYGTKFFGPDYVTWTWDRALVGEFRHPLSRNPMLEGLFGRAQFEVSGDLYSPQVSAFSLTVGASWPRKLSHVPTYRQILDVFDPEDSLAIYWPGASGHPLSHYYDNLLKPFWSGEYFALGPGMMTQLLFQMLPQRGEQDE